MKLFRKPRCDSYEATLTNEEREQLYAWLLQPGLSVAETAQRAPAWRGGKRDGQKPGHEAVAKIGRRLRISSALSEVAAAAKVERAALTGLLGHLPPGAAHEESVDLAMRFLAQDVISKTLDKLDPEARTAAAKVLLMRSDINLERLKFKVETTKYLDAVQAAKAKNKQAGAHAGSDGGIPDEVLKQIEQELKLL